MTTAAVHLENAKQHVRDAVRDVSPFIEHFARFGFAAKGVVYCVIGVLAALVPVGMTNKPVGTRGALQTILQQPIGAMLLGVVAFGLLCFGIWNAIRGIEDPELE